MYEILVVEDDKSVIETIVEVLQAHNYRVSTAEDGLAALERIKDSIPDLILSDIMMPQINGFELKELLHKNKSLNSIPFIFMSARSRVEDIRNGMNLGADDYITKPFKAKELINVIKLRLDRTKALNERLDEIINNMDLYIPHEFRTPLNALLGYSELLMNNGDKLSVPELNEIYNSINKSTKRLHSIIEKMTLLQSFNNGKGKYEVVVDYPNTKDIEDFILSAVSEHNRNHDLKINLEESEFNFNTNHLKFILKQIIDNACKFSGHGSTIEVNSKVEDGDYSLKITDYGKGLSEDQLSRLNAFVQFDKCSEQQIGNGLGLYISKKIIEYYGGKLSISSDLNKFTTVKLKLKCTQ